VLAIISRLNEKVKRILPRSVFVSIFVFIFAATVINTVPPVVLSNSLRERGKEQVETRAMEIAKNGQVIAQKNERVVILDKFARITYDSAEVGNLKGKILLTQGVYNALTQGKDTKSEIEEEVLVSHAAVRSDGGVVFVCQEDKSTPTVLRDIKTSLLVITILVGAVFILVIILGALKTKRRLKTLISGILSNKQHIEVSGDDEIAQLAGELNKLSRQILETEELRRTFVSDASHELRTPLSSIQLLVDSIIQTENIEVDTTREFLIDIGEQIDRLSRIAERLLLLTNLDGAKDLTLVPVDMKKVAESVIATLEQSAAEAQVELNCNLAEGVIFNGTSDGTYQIIFNLVENAIKYNRPGGCVRVYIFKNGGICNLIVDDNGIGIPEEDFQLIFERFYRVDKARSRDKGGSGLGLSIVSKIVGYFGGEIKVEPSVDGGTRFTFTVPEEVAE